MRNLTGSDMKVSLTGSEVTGLKPEVNREGLMRNLTGSDMEVRLTGSEVTGLKPEVNREGLMRTHKPEVTWK